MRVARPSRWSAEAVEAGEQPVVVVSGELDGTSRPRFGDQVRKLITGTAGPVVVDLSRVGLLSASAIRELMALADSLARTGRRLRVVTGTGVVLRVLRIAQATDVIETFVTLDAAAADAKPATELDRLRLEVADLRAKLATRPVIARALGMLQERYRLADMDEAYRLLRHASQTHNVKLLVLAKALVELPPPRDRTWLAGPVRRPAPSLSFGTGGSGTTPDAVLERLLRVALEGTGAAAGYAQVPDGTGLRLAAHRGLGSEVAGAFAQVEGEQSTCTAALLRDTTVTSTDIARDPLFSRPGTRSALLGAGFGAARSVPLRFPASGCVGVLTALYENAGRLLDGPAWGRVDGLCGETGVWLHWYHRRQVYTALRHLHARATEGQSGQPDAVAPHGRRPKPGAAG